MGVMLYTTVSALLEVLVNGPEIIGRADGSGGGIGRVTPLGSDLNPRSPEMRSGGYDTLHRATVFTTFTGEASMNISGESLLHKEGTCEETLSEGLGAVVMVNDLGTPAQPPAVGVTVMVETIRSLLLLSAAKEGMPRGSPGSLNPMVDFSFVQLNIVPPTFRGAPVKSIGAVCSPKQKAGLEEGRLGNCSGG